MQLPNPPAAIANTPKDLGPAEMICSERQNFVLIGRDRHTHVGGCADMLMLFLLERREQYCQERLGFEWSELEPLHSWLKLWLKHNVWCS